MNKIKLEYENSVNNLLSFSKTIKIVENSLTSINNNGVNWKLLNFNPINLN